MSDKTLVAATTLALAVALLLAMDVAYANPFSFFWTHIEPIPGTTPPAITIFSPQNDSVCSNLVNFSFYAAEPRVPVAATNGLSDIGYKLDWNTTTLHDQTVFTQGNVGPHEFNYSNLLYVPPGNHSLTVHVMSYVLPGAPSSMQVFSVQNSVTVYFSVDASLDKTPPSISSLNVENKTYNSDLGVPLYISGFNEPTSWVGYSVDNGANVTYAGITFIARLSDGYHNVTAYANDTQGNMGKSETFFFSTKVQHTTPNPYATAESLTQQPTSTVDVDGHGPIGMYDPHIYDALIITVLAAVTVAVVLGIVALLFLRRAKKRGEKKAP